MAQAEFEMHSERLRKPSVLLALLGASGIAICASSAAIGQPGTAVPFVDRTAESGLDFVYFNGMNGELYFVEMMGGGLAVLDYDNDGDLDVFIVQGELLGDDTMDEMLFPARQPSPQSDRLFRNDGYVDDSGAYRLAFVDVTERAGLPAGGYGLGVSSADVDNDGFADLYVMNLGSNRLLRNRADGTFEEITETSGTDDPRWSAAGSFLDYDLDGLLDLFVANYVNYRWATRQPCFSDTGVLDYCGPGAFDGVTDRLFRNRGGGEFEDASKRSGVGLVPGKGLGSAASDFDGDGQPDIYVTNDGEVNFMWMNQGDGTFQDGALLSGTAVNLQGMPEASMGVVIGDLNSDGLDDLFMAHLKSETNTVYLNEGMGLFSDWSNESGLGLPSWSFTGFGVGLLDFDGDGHLDIYVANGAVLLLEDLLAAGDPLPLHQRNLLFVNDGQGRFTDVSEAAGEALEPSEVSRGVATGDIDNDGDSDILVFNVQAPTRLLVNEVGSRRSWIGVKTRSWGGRDALGSRAMARAAGDAEVWRRIATDGSFASASDPRVLFGLRDAAHGTVEVHWLTGPVTRYENVTTGHYLVVERPGGE